MSDVKQCDRCGSVSDKTDWRHSLRANVTFTEHTKAATAYNPTTLELCNVCASELQEWVEQ